MSDHMDLDKLIVGRRYRFTALKRGEQSTVEGAFLGIAQQWWSEDDVGTKIIVYKRDDQPGWWFLGANRVTNIEPLD
jgi:hypothetical protein